MKFLLSRAGGYLPLPVLPATRFDPLFKLWRKGIILFVNRSQHIGDLSSASDDHLFSLIGEREHGCLLLPKFPGCNLYNCHTTFYELYCVPQSVHKDSAFPRNRQTLGRKLLLPLFFLSPLFSLILLARGYANVRHNLHASVLFVPKPLLFLSLFSFLIEYPCTPLNP